MSMNDNAIKLITGRFGFMPFPRPNNHTWKYFIFARIVVTFKDTSKIVKLQILEYLGYSQSTNVVE